MPQRPRWSSPARGPHNRSTPLCGSHKSALTQRVPTGGRTGAAGDLTTRRGGNEDETRTAGAGCRHRQPNADTSDQEGRAHASQPPHTFMVEIRTDRHRGSHVPRFPGGDGAPGTRRSPGGLTPEGGRRRARAGASRRADRARQCAPGSGSARLLTPGRAEHPVPRPRIRRGTRRPVRVPFPRPSRFLRARAGGWPTPGPPPAHVPLRTLCRPAPALAQRFLTFSIALKRPAGMAPPLTNRHDRPRTADVPTAPPRCPSDI